MGLLKEGRHLNDAINAKKIVLKEISELCDIDSRTSLRGNLAEGKGYATHGNIHKGQAKSELDGGPLM